MKHARFLFMAPGLSAALAMAGCSGDSSSAAAPQQQAPILVALAEAAPASPDGGLVATGTVRAKRETVLSFASPGRVAAVLADDGDRVGRGQLLARLDPAPVAAASAAARAEAARADADLARLAALERQGWITKPRVESARAAAAAARARVTQTNFDARFSRIVAPTGGVVLRRHVEPNQNVDAGTPIVTIGETSSGYVLRLPLPDADLARVQLGQGADVAIPALGAATLRATVSEVAGRGDERTGTFEVELTLPAAPGLKSGLIGTARIRTGRVGEAVAVPAAAIFQARADEGFVYVVPPGSRVARLRMVQLGPVDDREVIVTSGLVAGERVVRAGIERLRDGATITTGRTGA